MLRNMIADQRKMPVFHNMVIRLYVLYVLTRNSFAGKEDIPASLYAAENHRESLNNFLRSFYPLLNVLLQNTQGRMEINLYVLFVVT
jgi:hypothetical protein